MKDRRLWIPPTLLLAFSALFSRGLGIMRDHLLASTFGAASGHGLFNLDTYYAAFEIPDMLYNLLILGTISAAFIPIFTRYRKEGDEESAWAFANSMMHLMFIGVAVIAGVAYLFAPWLARFVGAGFGPEDWATTVHLMRIMLLSPLFFSVAGVLISIQDSYKHFFFRSLAPLFYNGGIILGILKFGREFGVVGVTWGVVLGAALQLLIQLPALKLVHFRYKPQLGWRRPDVRKAFKLMGPRVLGLSITQLTTMLNTVIASFMATGSITIFYLSDNLQNLPIGLIGISFAITSFATLSELASEPTSEAFTLELRRVLQAILFLIIPATVGLFLLRHEIVDVILLAGRFTIQDAEMTAAVLGFMAISLFAQSLTPVLSRGFYAFHNTATPLYAGAAGALVAVTGSLFLGLSLDWGIKGIAVATSVGNILTCVLLYGFMTRHLQRDILDWKKILRIVVVSALMGAAVAVARGLVPFTGTLLEKIGWLAVPVAVGAGVYFLIMRVAGLKVS